MINLLPDETKRQLRAARTNSSLIKYIIFLLISIVFLSLACAASYVIMNDSHTNAEKIIATSQTKSDSYLSVVNQATALSQKLLLTKNILDQQISYSNIIMGLAAVFPEGVVIDSLSLSNSTIGTPTTIKARAKTASDSTLLKTNLQNSLLFSNYSLKSITTDPSDTTGYPVLINIEITINKSASL